MPPRRSSRASKTNDEAAASSSSSSSSSSVFAGLTICTAGKHARTQAQLKQIVAENGGTAVGSQTKACTHLLADALGTAKTDAAVRAGIAVVTEQWLLQSAEEGKLSQDAKLLLSAPAAKEAEEGEGEEGAGSSSSAAAAAPKRKRKEDAEKSADGAAAEDGAASSSSAASPAAKKQKGDDTAASDDAAAASSSSSAAPAAAPALTFAGKKFVVMGGFDAGKFKVESSISTHGGEVTTSILKSLDYCVYGKPVSTDYGGVSGPGSKKYKEAKKMKRVTMLSEEEFFKAVAAIEAAKTAGAGASSGSGDGSTAAAGADHEMVVVFKSILSLLGASNTKLTPATLASVTAAEDEMRLALPPGLKALLLHVSDGSEPLQISDGSEGGLVELPYLWPSVADILEQFSYNDCFPSIFRDCKWIPYHMIDYDMCWDAIDCRSGDVFQIDMECNSYRDLGYTFEGRIHNFKYFLEQRQNKEKEKEAKDATTAATTTTAEGEGAGAGEGTGDASSSSGSVGRPSRLRDEFEASPLSGRSSRMSYAQQTKFFKACKKAGVMD